MNVDFEAQTMGQMLWSLADVAPEGHPNEGLTVLQRMEKYGIDPEGGAVSYNRLMRKEREEAVRAGIAPTVPITEETAITFARDIAAAKWATYRRWIIIGGVALGVVWWMRRKRG